MPTASDLVTDLPADFEVFGQAVATSMADLLGGTTGQVLAKNSATDMDFIWVAQDDSNAIQNAIVDAKGDLIGATAADTPARLAVGANGTVLTADSTAATGLAWAAVVSSTPPFVGAIAYGAVNLAFNTTATAISGLTTEIVDTNNFHSTVSNTERMTIPTGYGGKYLIQMDMNLASTASMQNIYLRVRKNGTNITEGLTNGNLATILTGLAQDGHLNVSLLVTGVATDYFDLTIQTGASSSTIDKARYSFTYLGA